MGILEMVLRAEGTAESTPQIQRSIDRAEDMIKEYCGLAEIPESAYGLWRDMTLAILAEEGNGGNTAALSSLTMGDLSYSFRSEEGGAAALMADFKGRLRRLRRGLFR